MKTFWPIKLSACAALLAFSAGAAEQRLTFAPPFRSGMVLADWRGSEETNIVLQGSQPEGQTVFVRFGPGKEIKAESKGTEWRLRVKQLKESKLDPPSVPFHVVAIATEWNWGRKPTETNSLTNVLVGDVWVVEAGSGWNPAPEIKMPGASVRFFLGDPTKNKGSDWFPAGLAAGQTNFPAVAAYFAEALSTNQMRPVGIYVTDRLPPDAKTDTKNLNTWDGDGKLNYTQAGLAASAARKKAVQKRGEERAVFIGKSRAAKSQGQILAETLPPVYDNKFFSYGYRGTNSNSLPVFGQIHVHGFLW